MLKRSDLYLSLVLLLFINFNLRAQNSDLTTTETANLSTNFNLTLQHTTLVVSDFETSKKFYINILGLRQIKADWLPENQMFLAFGPNLELHVGEVAGVDINPSSFNHFAFSVNNLDAYLEYLNSHGIKHSSLGGSNDGEVYKRPDGVRQTFIQDPDGYWIEINDFN